MCVKNSYFEAHLQTTAFVSTKENNLKTKAFTWLQLQAGLSLFWWETHIKFVIFDFSWTSERDTPKSDHFQVADKLFFPEQQIESQILVLTLKKVDTSDKKSCPNGVCKLKVLLLWHPECKEI